MKLLHVVGVPLASELLSVLGVVMDHATNGHTTGPLPVVLSHLCILSAHHLQRQRLHVSTILLFPMLPLFPNSLQA